MDTQRTEIENVTFQALSHPIRRTIIRIIQSRKQGISYTELITELSLSTGKLNYHLEQLKGLLEKSSNQYYVLTSLGKKAVEHLDLIEKEISPEDAKYIKAAASAQNSGLQPIMKGFLSIGTVAMLTAIGFWLYIGYVAITEGAPIIIYVALPILVALGICIVGLLLYALIKTPKWIKRIEQKYFGEIYL
jgi:predicted transcriptional regulator